MDLKHLDAQKLKDITGGNLELILNNFKYLAQHCPNKVIVRMPVIPRFNDDICGDVIRFCANFFPFFFSDAISSNFNSYMSDML